MPTVPPELWVVVAVPALVQAYDCRRIVNLVATVARVLPLFTVTLLS